MPADIGPGARGMGVRRTQEWLAANGHHTAIDGAFGPATEAALKAFQKSKRLGVTGRLNLPAWLLLTAALRAAVEDSKLGLRRGMDHACLRIARQHLKQYPHELGGDNRGPWVRSYMLGRDGPEWYWCAGFVSFVLLQAWLQIGGSKTIVGSVSCDTLESASD